MHCQLKYKMILDVCMTSSSVFFTAIWHYVKEHLNKHEAERFMLLKNIDTDAGRGRSWLRASLNEHSLERYIHMLLEKEDLLG